MVGKLASMPHEKENAFYLQTDCDTGNVFTGCRSHLIWIVFSIPKSKHDLIVDEPTTGLDPEERIRIRNLLVDFSEGRTVLFSTHVVEDLAATCNQLAVMKNGRFLYSGNMKELLEQARGHIWICKTKEERTARELEKKYHVSSKQYVGDELQMKLISETPPKIECSSCEATLEDAYIYLANKEL